MKSKKALEITMALILISTLTLTSINQKSTVKEEGNNEINNYKKIKKLEGEIRTYKTNSTKDVINLTENDYQLLKNTKEIRWLNQGKETIISSEKIIGGDILKTNLLMDGDFLLIGRDDRAIALLKINSLSDNIVCNDDSYRCLSIDIRKNLKNKTDIAKITNDLSRRIKSDKNFEYTCHDLAHLVGIYSLSLTNSPYEAITYNDPICDNGYTHGITEFLTLTLNDEELKEVYSKLCKGEEDVQPVSCIHGLGHGAYLRSGGDLEKGLSFCQLLNGKDTHYFTNRELCAAGVSMQYANEMWGELGGKGLELGRSYIAKCKKIKDIELKNGCMMYILNGFNHEYKDLTDVSRFCNQSSLSYYCWYGLAFAVGYGFRHDLEDGKRLCLMADKEVDKEICYLNLIGQKLEYIKNLEEESCRNVSKRLCALSRKLIRREIPNPT